MPVLTVPALRANLTIHTAGVAIVARVENDS
jgi:hypothetical protein